MISRSIVITLIKRGRI